MKSKGEILRILKQELPFIRAKYKVSRIALFGSYVRGEQKKESDVDVLVEFEEPVGYFKFIELEEYLSLKLRAKVDLVTPDALKSLIKPDIMGEAVYA
jgi:predicted nucleotidyltransferase